MLAKMLKAKIQRATVTQTDVDYHGSITIDTDLLRASGPLPNKAVAVADCDNGNRFETYVIAGGAGSGVIVMSYVHAVAAEITGHMSRVVICDDRTRANEIVSNPSSI